MSASVAGAIKAYLEASTPSLGVPVFRDHAPQSQAYPYVTVWEGISTVPGSGDNGQNTHATETVQVDVWEQYRDDTTNALVESYTLSGEVARRLHGAKLPTAPATVYGVTVLNSVRTFEADGTVLRRAITANVKRKF